VIIPFGKYSGRDTSDLSIPDSYIKWMALRGTYTNPENRFETTWKVPIELSIIARREMEARGYKRVGDKYVKEDV
jgi:uncharacterized protein (DUF3820 family)